MVLDHYYIGKYGGSDGFVENIAWARAQFGAKFDAFADAWRPDPRFRRLLARQRIMVFIDAFAVVVALMLAGEFLWFR